MKIYYSKTMEKSNPICVDSKTGRVKVNAALWRKIPKEVKYFLLRWTKYSPKGGVYWADCNATKDYINNGYSKKILYKWFTKFLSAPTSINAFRATLMVANFKNIIKNESRRQSKTN